MKYVDFQIDKINELTFYCDYNKKSFYCDYERYAEGIKIIPAKEPFNINVSLYIPGYGKTWLTADNRGNGYKASQQKVDLLYGIADSQLKSIMELCENNSIENLPVLENALQLFESYIKGKDDILYEVIRLFLIIGEDLTYEIAKTKLRQKSFNQPFISGTLFGERLGKWAIGVGPDWAIEDEPPDFIRSRSDIKKITEICDATTLPNFWRWIEPERGKIRWEPLDRIIDICNEKNMKVKSFALFWSHLGGLPIWFRNLGFSDQLNALEVWIKKIVNRYRGEIICWETCNEMHDWANMLSWNHNQLLKVTKLTNDLVGSLDPDADRLINFCCPWGDYIQTGASPFGKYDRIDVNNRWSPLRFLEIIMDENISFESIGVQMYNPGRDLMECDRLLKKYISLSQNKTVWITEMGTPSGTETQTIETSQTEAESGWRGAWNQEKQAKWIKYWYTIASSHSKLDGLNYWDVTDKQAFIRKSGWINEEGLPKKSYYILKEFCKKFNMGQKRIRKG